MTVTEIFFGLFGGALGGIIVSLIKSHLDKKNEISINLNKIIEDKYRSLLVFMACALDIKKKKYFTLNEQIPLNTKEEYLQQIKEYYYHSVLYS